MVQDMIDIGRGDFYEDCASQPVLCAEVDYSNGQISGISLLSGLVDCCSIENCGVRKLEADEAIERAVSWGLSNRAEFQP
jgi:hypothetical protein